MAINDKVLFTVQPITSVKIVSWIVFLCGLFGAPLLSFLQFWIVQLSAGFGGIGLVILPLVTLLSGIVLIITSFGLRKMRRWAFHMCIYYLIFIFVSLIFSLWYTQVMITPQVAQGVGAMIGVVTFPFLIVLTLCVLSLSGKRKLFV